MTDWRWRPERTMGIWRHGAGWLRPFVAAAPYVTVGLLLLMHELLESHEQLLAEAVGDAVHVGTSVKESLIVAIEQSLIVFLCGLLRLVLARSLLTSHQTH